MCKVNYAVQRDESGKGGGWRVLLEKYCFVWFETLDLWFNFNAQVKNDSTRIQQQPAKTPRYASNIKI